MKATYQTRQRKLLTEYLCTHGDRQFTIEELKEELGDEIPLSSVYRLMNKLLEEGIVRKYPMENSRSFSYQIVNNEACHHHLHMQCTGCGKLVHLSEEATEAAKNLVSCGGTFELDYEKTLLYGTCPNCKKP